MAKIFYGNRECEIQGEDIVYCELRLKYPIEINDKSPDGFIIKAKNNKIIIVKFFQNKATQLKEMFSYIGELNIIRAAVLNKNGDREHPTIKKVMDYSELLATNAEDMTTLSENIRTTHVHGRRVTKMKLMQPYLENMTTGHDNFYLKDNVTSDFIKLLNPIAKKLKVNSLIRVKANLTTVTHKQVSYKEHADQPFKCKAAIYYINTNNGYTLIGDKRIESQQNRMVFFDADTKHGSASATDCKNRMVINFNYF